MFQGSLFAQADSSAGVDEAFTRLERIPLDDRSWVDLAAGWLAGADGVFDALVDSIRWDHKVVRMYDRWLPEPRLTAWWSEDHGVGEPLPVLGEARAALSEHYGVHFNTIGFNWYRDGDDSVAWHADRRGPRIADPVIAIVSVGDVRPFRMRPIGGGRSRSFEVGHGDLLVMGGACQDRWQHAVPKVRHAGGRISVTFRHSGIS